MNTPAFVKRYSAWAYFVLTFVISWGGVLLVIGGPGKILSTAEQVKSLLPFAVMAMVAGPSVAGILSARLVYGNAGLRELFSRLLKWRAGIRWYALALLPAPILAATILATLSLISPAFLPGIFISGDKASLLLSGLAAGSVAGLFEELGWTGFVIPRLRLRHGVFATGVIVGILWGLWHFLVGFWGNSTSSGALSLSLVLPSLLFYIGVLPAYRVLMVWVYNRTKSLTVAMVMHGSLTAVTTFILAPTATGAPLAAYYLIFAATLWIIIAAAAVADSRSLLNKNN